MTNTNLEFFNSFKTHALSNSICPSIHYWSWSHIHVTARDGLRCFDAGGVWALLGTDKLARWGRHFGHPSRCWLASTIPPDHSGLPSERELDHNYTSDHAPPPPRLFVNRAACQSAHVPTCLKHAYLTSYELLITCLRAYTKNTRYDLHSSESILHALVWSSGGWESQ